MGQGEIKRNAKNWISASLVLLVDMCSRLRNSEGFLLVIYAARRKSPHKRARPYPAVGKLATGEDDRRKRPLGQYLSPVSHSTVTTVGDAPSAPLAISFTAAHTLAAAE